MSNQAYNMDKSWMFAEIEINKYFLSKKTQNVILLISGLG